MTDPVFETDLPGVAATPPLADARARLRALIRSYVRTGSPATAAAVVRLIETLCDHPSFEARGAERCAFLRLKTHWRCLATTAATD